MSALTVRDEVFNLQPQFEKITQSLDFLKEAQFAMQALEKNDFLMKTAVNNKKSLINAVINVAAIGLSLSPVEKLTYLVPYAGSVELSISYVGLLKIATDTGSVLWADVQLVFAGEKLTLRQGSMPIHDFDPLDPERMKNPEKLIGVYVTIKTSSGEYLTTVMNTDEIHKIRARSEGWKAYVDKKIKSTPWSTDYYEMVKKTVIKRASKMWPKTKRLDAAIHVLNQHEGIDFDKETKDATVPSEEKVNELKSIIASIAPSKSGESTEVKLLKHLSDRAKENLPSIDLLSNEQVNYAISFLKQYAPKPTEKKPDEIKPEEKTSEHFSISDIPL